MAGSSYASNNQLHKIRCKQPLIIIIQPSDTCETYMEYKCSLYYPKTTDPKTQLEQIMPLHPHFSDKFPNYPPPV